MSKVEGFNSLQYLRTSATLQPPASHGRPDTFRQPRAFAYLLRFINFGSIRFPCFFCGAVVAVVPWSRGSRGPFVAPWFPSLSWSRGPVVPMVPCGLVVSWLLWSRGPVVPVVPCGLVVPWLRIIMNHACSLGLGLLAMVPWSRGSRGPLSFVAVWLALP